MTEPRLSLSGMRAFRAVAVHGSIRAAAAQLRLEPSTVSHQLKALETQLGVALFVRTTRSVTLTDAGRGLKASALPAMEQLEAAVDRARSTTTARRGVLRINMPWIAWPMAIGERIGEFAAAWPEITLDLSFSDRLSDIVALGSHAGIRFGHRVEPHMVTVPVSEPVRSVVVAAPGYLEERGVPSRPAELLQHQCLRYRFVRSQRLAPWDFMHRRRHLTVEVEGTFVADSQLALIERAREGGGIVQVPRALVDEALGDGSLVELLARYAYTYPALHLYYPVEHRGNELLRAFVETFKVESSRRTG